MKKEQNKKRLRRFCARRSSVISVYAFLLISFFSFTAELWSNSKPVMFSMGGNFFVPVLVDYHPSDFGVEGVMVTDYREMREKMDWAIWPINEWDPYERNKVVDEYPSAPDANNVMGTDDRGRDIFARTLYGFRYSVIFAVGTWFLSFLLGGIYGAISGYIGGRVDLVGQRIVEIFETMPILLILIMLASIFNPTLPLLILITVIFSWMFISFYVRAEFLSLRKREFVEAARAQGASHARIVFGHILPNALGPVITFSPFIIASNVRYLAILDFLGFGLLPPTPSWGELLSQSQQHFQYAWWLALYPSLALFSTLVILNLISDGVRDAFDPKRNVT